MTDDIWSLIAFGNDKIGMMWSNQKLGAFSFAVHNDAGADATWQAPEVALSRRGYSVRSGAGAARG